MSRVGVARSISKSAGQPEFCTLSSGSWRTWERTNARFLSQYRTRRPVNSRSTDFTYFLSPFPRLSLSPSLSLFLSFSLRFPRKLVGLFISPTNVEETFYNFRDLWRSILKTSRNLGLCRETSYFLLSKPCWRGGHPSVKRFCNVSCYFVIFNWVTIRLLFFPRVGIFRSIAFLSWFHKIERRRIFLPRSTLRFLILIYFVSFFFTFLVFFCN